MSDRRERSYIDKTFGRDTRENLDYRQRFARPTLERIRDFFPNAFATNIGRDKLGYEWIDNKLVLRDNKWIDGFDEKSGRAWMNLDGEKVWLTWDKQLGGYTPEM